MFLIKLVPVRSPEFAAGTLKGHSLRHRRAVFVRNLRIFREMKSQNVIAKTRF